MGYFSAPFQAGNVTIQIGDTFVYGHWSGIAFVLFTLSSLLLGMIGLAVIAIRSIASRR
jgi:hypothetical protein